jgi:hypothetical protein
MRLTNEVRTIWYCGTRARTKVEAGDERQAAGNSGGGRSATGDLSVAWAILEELALLCRSG